MKGTPVDVNAVLEKDLTGYVRELAQLFGWRRYHTWLAKHSPAGFPDEVLLRRNRLIFAELKREKKKPTPAQQEWLEELAEFAHHVNLGGSARVDVYVWRPSDMDRIAEILR
jgi:hypothetical protein